MTAEPGMLGHAIDEQVICGDPQSLCRQKFALTYHFDAAAGVDPPLEQRDERVGFEGQP